MLDERVDDELYTMGEDGLPVRKLDEAYRARMARMVEEMTGKPPIWTLPPEEQLRAMEEWRAATRQRLEEAGVELVDIPNELLRREHIYDD